MKTTARFKFVHRIATVTFTAVASMAFAQTALATKALPAAESEEFCQVAQQILANTAQVSTNEVFDNMPDYRASKPSVDPLLTYQVVSYSGATPVMVSCKVKTADHLIAQYGDGAAGEQTGCPALSAIIRAEAVAELNEAGNTEAAAAAQAIVLDNNEPYITGSSYLSDFELSYAGDDGKTHINSPGLQVEWESWWAYVLPEKFVGQTYCHLATTQYYKALATGEMQPGLTMTTTDDAPVTPQ